MFIPEQNNCVEQFDIKNHENFSFIQFLLTLHDSALSMSFASQHSPIGGSMNTKLGFIKLTALAAVCALGFGVTSANADGFRSGHHGGWNGHGHNRSHFSLSINLANALFGGGYYNAPRHHSRDRYYDYYGYNDNYGSNDNYAYYDGYNNYDPGYGYYEPYPQYSIGFSYSDRGYGDRYGHDRSYRYRNDGGHWNGDRGDRGARGWDGDHDQHGGWDRDHYYNDHGGNYGGDADRTGYDENSARGFRRHHH